MDFEPHRREQTVIPPPTLPGVPSATSHSYTTSSANINTNSYPAYQYNNTHPGGTQRVLPNQSYTINPTLTSNSTYYGTSTSAPAAPSPAVTAVTAVERDDEREWDEEELAPTMCGFYHHQNSEPCVIFFSFFASLWMLMFVLLILHFAFLWVLLDISSFRSSM